MREGLFLILYGLLFISGSFMCFAWGRLALVRLMHLPWRRWRHDRYLLVSFGLALNSLMTAGLFGTRAAESFVNGVWVVDGLLGVAILFFLAGFEVSKVVLMWAIGLNPAARSWRAFAAFSVIWTAFAIYWVFTS